MSTRNCGKKLQNKDILDWPLQLKFIRAIGDHSCSD